MSNTRPAPSPAPSPAAATVLFASDRAALLRGVTLLCFAPVPLTSWLVSLAPRAEWEATAGTFWWWLLPAGLIALSLVLPAAILWLHDRYVLRLERSGGRLVLTTFLVWGRRTRAIDAAEFHRAAVRFDEGRAVTGLAPVVNAPSLQLRLPGGRRLILDAQGEAPEGWHAVYALTADQRTITPTGKSCPKP